MDTIHNSLGQNDIFSILSNMEISMGINAETILLIYKSQQSKHLCESLEKELLAYKLDNNSLTKENQYLSLRIKALEKRLKEIEEEKKALHEKIDNLLKEIPEPKEVNEERQINLSKIKGEIKDLVSQSETKKALRQLRNLSSMLKDDNLQKDVIVLLGNCENLSKKEYILGDKDQNQDRNRIHYTILTLLENLEDYV